MSATSTTFTNSEGVTFYGWRVLAAVFVGLALATGCTSYAFTLFVVPVGNELDLSRATVNLGLMLILVGMGLAAPIVGRLLDRFPARRILIGGAFYMGFGFIILGLSSSPWVMAGVLLLIVGPGTTAIGPLSAATVVSRWFNRHRGLALGITAVATSLGGAILVPAIGFSMSLIGWRGALLIMGGIIAVVVSLIAFFVVREPPGFAEPVPDKNAADEASRDNTSEDNAWRISQILKDKEFWWIGIAIGFALAVNQSVLVSLVPLGVAVGLEKAQAALLVTLVGIVAVFGKLLCGAAADRINIRNVFVAVTVVTFLEAGLFWMHSGLLTLMAAVLLAGVAIGGGLPAWQALVAERFGKQAYGTILGLMQFLVTICCGMALYYVGHVFDVTGNYDRAFFVFMAVSALAIGFALLIPARRRQTSAKAVVT